MKDDKLANFFLSMITDSLQDSNATKKQSPADNAQAIRESREAFMHLLELMGPVLETVNGYRTQCISEGYSPDAAEKMAVEFHSFIIESIKNHHADSQ